MAIILHSRLTYLHAYDTVAEAHASLRHYFNFYNRKRLHSSLDEQTPERAYYDHLPPREEAWISPQGLGRCLRSGAGDAPALVLDQQPAEAPPKDPDTVPRPSRPPLST